MDLETFERQVMTALLAGDDPLLERLREQYAAATIRDREKTTNGFVTRFEIPSNVSPIERTLLHLDDLQLQLAGTTAPADTSAHVQNGRLRSLECFVYDGAFPESPEIEAAWFYGTARFDGITDELLAERDVEELLEDDEEPNVRLRRGTDSASHLRVDSVRRRPSRPSRTNESFESCACPRSKRKRLERQRLTLSTRGKTTGRYPIRDTEIRWTFTRLLRGGRFVRARVRRTGRWC